MSAVTFARLLYEVMNDDRSVTMDDAVKRAVKKCLKDNGFDASVIDELIAERKTIRDDFAKEAMASLIRCSTYPFGGAVDSIISTAYAYADQALIQREVKH